MKRVLRMVFALSCVLEVSACGEHGPAVPPAPTVATAEPIRGDFSIARAGQSQSVAQPLRVERGATAVTGADGRGGLALDTGAWLLLDRGTSVEVALDRVTLTAGRLWANAAAADETTVLTAGGSVTLSGAAVAVDLAHGHSTIYCASGEATYRSAQGNGRLEQGESVVLGAGAPHVEPEALWDDWTGGLADPAPRAGLSTSAIGALAARRIDERGVARTPLAIRGLDVNVEVVGDLATTQSIESFFNARSDVVEAEYIVRVPQDAVVQGFAVDTGAGFVDAVPSSLAVNNGYDLVWADSSLPQSSLTYDGPGELRARVYPIVPGATVRVRLSYSQWLSRRGDMRTYVYPMRPSGDPPLVGELVLQVSTRRASARGYRAGMGATVDRDSVVLRRSDFRPHADFYLDLLDEHPPADDTALAHRATYTPPAGSAVDGPEDYVLVDVPTAAFAPTTAARAPLDLVLLVDVSGATEPEDLDLARGVVESTLRELAPTDRVALRIGDLTAHSPDGGPNGLVPASDANREAFLDALAHANLGGATDLGQMLRDAAALVAGKPRATVLYLGDGLPTTGALDATALRLTLSTLDSPPRFFAFGVGDDANMGLLRALFGDDATAVHERNEASRAAMALLASAARPTLRGFTLDLGPTVERVYPRTPIIVPLGDHVRFVGRVRGALPKDVVARAMRDGERVTRTFHLTGRVASDVLDVRMRWATARLSELLDEDAGREALSELGVRYHVLTPWTPFVVGGVLGAPTQPVRDFDRDPYEVPWALGGGGGALVDDVLDAGSGWRRRMHRPEPDLPTSVESTWVPRVHELDPNAPEPAALAHGGGGDGGLGQAAAERALTLGERGPEGCYERKLNVHPDLSGDVTVSVAVEGTGAVKTASIVSSSIDADVATCVLGEVRGLQFAATGLPGEVTVIHTYHFEMPTRPIGTRQHCSDASRQSLDVRAGLWRERLAANSGIDGALSVWREALQQCELSDWRARRTLLDRMLASVGGVDAQIGVYRALHGDPTISSYLRRAILSHVRTPQDVIAVRNGLGLEAPVDWSVFERLWRAAHTPELRLTLVRRWLEVAPDEMDLRMRMLELLEQTHKLPEARRLARELRADPLADAKVRTAVGEFWLRQNAPDEARRVFSEIVEHAPLDPWARRRLGDLYRAHDWSDDAYREYTTLARLRPNDDSTWLLLALAAADAGRIDEALRLESRLSEQSDDDSSDDAVAAAARLWTAVRIARLKSDPALTNELPDVRARERESGALRDPPDVFVAFTFRHPDDVPELWARYPSTPPDIGWEAASDSSPGFGIEAVRVRERETGDYLFEVRRADRDSLRNVVGELLVVTSPASAAEHIVRKPVTLTSTSRIHRFRLAGNGEVDEVPVTVPAAPVRPAHATAP